MMQAMQKYGLKKRHLHNFQNMLTIFYDEVIVNQKYDSEFVLTYQKRFIQYRESLFTFLEHDGIPWHNNTAENAIRHLQYNRIYQEAFMSLLWHITSCYLVLGKHADFKGNRFSSFCFQGRQTWISLRHVNANGDLRLTACTSQNLRGV